MNRGDEAYLTSEQFQQEAMAKHREQKHQFRSVKPEGFCHTCYKEVDGDKLFCNGRCASKFGK